MENPSWTTTFRSKGRQRFSKDGKRLRRSATDRGFRSGLEEDVADQLAAAGVEAGYETNRLVYTVPAKERFYTPDFILPNGIAIECKGRFDREDRMKHLAIKESNPGLDLRFVFSNPSNKIYKGSKTSYRVWCMKHQFKWAHKRVPQEWIDEPPNPDRLAALGQILR